MDKASDSHNLSVIEEMEHKGIYSTVEMSKIFEREHGINIAPHIISELKYRECRER